MAFGIGMVPIFEALHMKLLAFSFLLKWNDFDTLPIFVFSVRLCTLNYEPQKKTRPYGGNQE